MPKVNNTVPKKINGIALGTAVQVGAWTARPGTGDGSGEFDTPVHGDFYRVSSSADGLLATYRYSATVGEWVRPEVFQGNPTVRARIQGDRLPSAESPAWTETAANGGSISTDGTKVTLNGSTSNDTAFCKYSHNLLHELHFFQGLVQSIGNQAGAGNNRGRSIVIDCPSSPPSGYGNSRYFNVTLNTNAPTASFAKGAVTATRSRYSSTAITRHDDMRGRGTQLQSGSIDGSTKNVADATTSEVLMEIYVIPRSGSFVYINNMPTPMAVKEFTRAHLSTSTTTGSYIVGDWETTELGHITIREAFFGTYSPTANTASVFGIYGGA